MDRFAAAAVIGAAAVAPMSVFSSNADDLWK